MIKEPLGRGIKETENRRKTMAKVREYTQESGSIKGRRGASLEVKRGKEVRVGVEEDMFVDGRSGGNCV